MSTFSMSFLFRKTLIICVLAGLSVPLYGQHMPVTTASDEAEALFTEGRELFDKIRFDEARDVFDEALQKDPSFAMANVYRAMIATTDADFVDHLSKALNAKNDVSDGERLLIESINANSKNRPMEALNYLKEARALYPQDKRLHHMLGIAFQGVNMRNDAEREFKAALQIDPDFPPPYNNLGYLYRGSGNFADAEEAFQNYIRLLPDEANPHDSIADLYTKMGKYDQAIEHYQTAVELNPNFFFSQQKTGDNMMFKGLYEDGRLAYRKAIEMAPTVTDKIFIHQSLANSYLYEDNYGKASEEVEAAIKWAENESLPENAATLYQEKAMMDIEQGQLDQAGQDLAACDKIMETANLTENRKRKLESYSLRNRAILAAKGGNFEEAVTNAERLNELAIQSESPNDKETYHLVNGIIHYEQGDFVQAVEELKQSDPNDVYGQFYLAQSYQKSGKRDKADALFTRIAQWNEHSLEYALVRNKARSAAKIGIAIEGEEQ